MSESVKWDASSSSMEEDIQRGLDRLKLEAESYWKPRPFKAYLMNSTTGKLDSLNWEEYKTLCDERILPDRFYGEKFPKPKRSEKV